MVILRSGLLPDQDRLDTLAAVRAAGISVCAGGIIGLGEGPADRVGLLHQLATLPEHPESVPINALVAVKGTPLQNQPPPSALEVGPPSCPFCMHGPCHRMQTALHLWGVPVLARLRVADAACLA
jgi:2-iminoacetate synthase ThiH